MHSNENSGIQGIINFLNGQCFNFAYALCQEIQGDYCCGDLQLATAIGTRTHHAGFDWVCIHCVVKIKHHDMNQAVHLDVQGVHSDEYLEKIAETWRDVEFEITGVNEEIEIFTYNFDDSHELAMYWHDLEKAGAQKNLAIIHEAKVHIRKNLVLFENGFSFSL